MSQCFSLLVRQNAVSQNVWDIMHTLCLRTCLDYSRNKTDVLNCNVYSGDQTMKNEIGERCVYTHLSPISFVQAGKCQGKKPSGRPVRIRVDEIYLLVRGLRGVDWTYMVRTGTSGGALNTAMKLRISENAGYFLNNWKTISFARRTLVLIYWLFMYLLTYSMEQSPSWKANWFCS